MSRSLPAPPTDPLSALRCVACDGSAAHATVEIDTPESITTGRCIPCVISKPVWTASPTNWQHSTWLQRRRREHDGVHSPHEIILPSYGSDHIRERSHSRRLEERVIDFEGVQWQNREGWASAEEPA